MLKALQPGIEINVCKLDRLARNVEDVLEIAEKIRKSRGYIEHPRLKD